MDINNMHIAVQHGVDKINSFQADSLLSEEIDLELNKSIMRFVNLKYGKNNMYGQGFEESQKRIDDLRSLVVSYEDLVYFKERRILKFRNSGSFSTNSSFLYVDKFELPTDYLYHISSYCNSFTSPNCKKDVEFKLQRLTGDRILVKVKLSQLRVNSNAYGGQIGWIPKITLDAGATPATGYNDIDLSNLSTIENIGTSFSMPIWEAVNSEDFAGTITSPTQSNAGGDLIWIGTPYAIAADGSEGPTVPAGVDWWRVIPSLTGGVNHQYNQIVPDLDGTFASQIIESVVSNPIDGVESYYENYLDESVPETFFFVIDTNVFNYVILAEEAAVIEQTLLSVDYSVNEDTSEVESVSGLTSSSYYSTVARAAYEVTVFLSGLHTRVYEGYRFHPSVSTDNQVLVTIPINYVDTDILNLDDYPGLVAQNPTSIIEIASPVETLSYPYAYSYIIDETLKRVLAGESISPDILNNAYWDGINLIGKRFAGISSPIKYIQHDDILTMLKDPFNKPDMDTILGMFDTNYINVHTLVEGTKASPLLDANYVDVLPYSVKLTYLKRPRQVSLDFNISSDLPQHTHEEIVAMTVSGILEGISDPRYKSQLNEASKNE
tara:strand:- start:3976 stop:5796 length:1821 start_codon:yes stop_codon:yes gene_type:complete